MGMTSSHVHDLLIIYGSMHSILSRTHNILSCVHNILSRAKHDQMTFRK